MGIRHKARELGMQALFYMDSRGDISMEKLEQFCDHFKPPKEVYPFFRELVEGIIRARNDIDQLIVRYSSNWKLSRMSCVDRNVMRISVYELLFRDDIPSKVSINEAIDIGKKYGSHESGAFINGILDSIRIGLENREIQADCPGKQQPQP